jgi:glycosyltransferase involved in cell wall biosynthesis
MDISVIICTYNRSDSLRRTLEWIRLMEVPPGIRWELLVVDNNSKDDTREVVESFRRDGGIDCTYLLERNQGLSFARNNGIRNAKGGIIAFTDDDVLVDRHWIGNLRDAFENHRDAACIGGKILPRWEKPCPPWLKGRLLEYLACCDHGDETLRMSEPRLGGANLAIRSHMVVKYGLFDTRLGHIGGKLYGGEECQYLSRMLEAGECLMYCPEVLVHHCIPASRISKAYFRKWKSDKGELYGLQMGAYAGRNLFGVPLIFIRKTLKGLIDCAMDPFAGRKDSIRNQLDLYYNLGVIRGRLKHRFGGHPAADAR